MVCVSALLERAVAIQSGIRMLGKTWPSIIHDGDDVIIDCAAALLCALINLQRIATDGRGD